MKFTLSFAVLATSEAAPSAQSAEEAVGNAVDKASGILSTLKSYEYVFIEFVLDVLIAIVIFLIGRFLIRQFLKVMDKVLTRSSMEEGLRKFVHSVLNVCGYIFLFLILLQILGVETTSMIAALTSAGVAIGLALQGALSNVAGGFLILLLKPFRVGDYISEEANQGAEGVVKRIDIFYTYLTTIDNKVILIPNGTLISSRIVNMTRLDKRRVDFQVGISYQSDIKKAKEVMWDVIHSIEHLYENETQMVFVKELGDSSVVMEARIWVPTEEYWNTLFYVNEEMKCRLEENGIEIPYNQLDVHIINPEK